MRSFSALINAVLGAEVARHFLLITLSTATPITVTDCDVPLAYGGTVWTPASLDLGDISIAPGFSVDSISLALGNVDQDIGYTLLSEDVQGAGALLQLAALTETYQFADAPVPFWRGMIDDWDLDEEAASMTLVNEKILWKKRTLRKSTVECPWVFKGTECAYAGDETWCNQTLTRCRQLDNVAHYEGNPYLKSVMEKENWWGRKPKL